MSEPFLGQIKIFGFNFAPRNWAQCDGQLLPINQNQSLYSLLGTTYGGDGRTNFGLPDLRGRTPIFNSDSIGLGHKGGAESVPLTADQLPKHTHTLAAANDGQDADDPAGNFPGKSEDNEYSTASNPTIVQFAQNTITGPGGGAHDNMQPFQVLNYCIALRGLFPSRN